MGESVGLPNPAGLEPSAFDFTIDHQRWRRRRSAVFIQGDVHEIRGVGVRALTGDGILGDHLDARLHRGSSHEGEFGFEGPYRSGLTYVNPVNHMGDTCASVGKIVWDESIAIPATYDPSSFVVGCMSDVLPIEEVRQLTDNPDVSDEALAKFYELAAAGG